ncbi:ATP-binding cassette domain-containing protein [Falsiroseomonas sp. HC035]|uniref:ATP-binding cassette domain-containing protein n=1 Tax=Falsiroseomonas sp. HC035 TaxID=3390999 RepID=UPI003D3119A2
MAAQPDPAADSPALLARSEILAASRFALALGLAISLAGFGVVAAKLAIWQLVLPTGNGWTLAGLAIAIGLAVALLLGLEQLRALGLIAVSHRLARRLAGPLVRAAAQRDPGADRVAGQALRDVEALRRTVCGPLLTGLADALLAPVLILLLLVFHWAFATWALACCGIAAMLSLLGERLTRRDLAEAEAAQARLAGQVADALRCAEAIAAMGMRDRLVAGWQTGAAPADAALRRARTIARRIAAGLGSLQALGAGGALVVGALLLALDVPVGFGMVLAMLVTGQAVAPFARLGAALHEAGAARAAWLRLGALGAAEAGPTLAYPCRTPRLVLDRVSFAHSGAARALLRDVVLEVSPGEIVALAGGTGSGKTTLLRIAIGMVRPSAGLCTLDGHATAQWARADLARHAGYLPQDPLLTDGTVAEAIARLEEPDLPAVLRAARLAEAHAMVASLPQGYATPIGPQFSAGQRQRLALARALYRDPGLLVLDEPSAFLDAEGEAGLVRMLRELASRGTAVLLSSHRPALLSAADRVVVLRSGQLLATERRRALAAPA